VDIRRRQLTQWAAALAATGAMPRLYAQNRDTSAASYPTHSMRLLIPFAVGGGTDIIGREIGHQMTLAWNQPVVVDNKAGGNGIIGLDMAARSDPDGYTLTMITASSSVNVTLQGHKQPYDLLRDFAPISQITTQPYVLVVNPNLPVKNVRELIALARSRQNPMTYGSSGVGGLSHLSGALFGSLADIPLSHIPYTGGAPSMGAVVSGQIDMTFSTRLQAHGLIAAGRLRALAVTGAQRSPASPELPTMQEAGVPDFVVAGWYGMLAPAHTPVPVVNKLNREIVRILKLPDVMGKMSADGSEPVGSSPQQFADHLASEVERWRVLIAKLGIPTQ
jgi:tripartite-type tricarboxylate transporter receptor subunit TctC